ncbi:hypothetical protein [Spirillospora sp. NBC_01491]|uniref:hypothetical protein n=1 Tax=Spirillospora sp. NBC_01491 TaxID=2976007 RepID=UPI002E324D67|nr:hypothetical protein [Spirillospora sp. NBC_01491]
MTNFDPDLTDLLQITAEYGGATPLDGAAAAIHEAIHDGDLTTARAMFTEAASTFDRSDLVQALAALTDPEPGTIAVGPGRLVFGNPLRVDFVGRCGTCNQRWRDDTGRPAVGVNYKTLRGALGWAREHAAEDHANSVTIQEVA